MPLDSLAISDIFILFSTVLALWFVLSYGLGSPWYRVKQHGWIGVMTILHSVSVFLLLFLITWAIVFDQRVTEAARLPIAVLLALALAVKVVILHTERRRGNIERRAALNKEKLHDTEQVSRGPAAGPADLGDRAPGGDGRGAV